MRAWSLALVCLCAVGGGRCLRKCAAPPLIEVMRTDADGAPVRGVNPSVPSVQRVNLGLDPVQSASAKGSDHPSRGEGARWTYVWRRSANAISAHDYSPSGTATVSAEEITIPVFECDGERCAVLPHGEECTTLVGQPRLASIRAIDRASDQIVDAILVNEVGVPMGPIGGPPVRIGEDFRGYVVARGYRPERLGKLCDVMSIALNRVGRVRGRLSGLYDSGDTVDCMNDEEATTVEIGPRGEFEFFALLLGASALRFASERGFVSRHPFVVREGEQDLGVIDVAPLGVLALRLGGAPSLTASVFVSLYRPEHRDLAVGDPLRFRVMSVDVLAGVCRVRQVLDGSIGGEVWTATGESGLIPPSVCSFGNAVAEVPVTLAAPGQLLITLDGAVLPPGCSVAAIDARYGRQPEALEASEFRSAHLRARRQVLQGRRMEIGGLWPSCYQIALLSPQGCVLVRARAEVESNRKHVVTLAVPDALGRLRATNVGTTSVRLALLAGDGGVAGRLSLPGGADGQVGPLPSGPYRLMEWIGTERGAEETRLRSIEVKSGTELLLEVGAR